MTQISEETSVLSQDSAENMALTFKALADPTRLRLLSILLKGERCVGDLAKLLNMQQSAISHQMRILRDLRFVSFRREGQLVYYRIDDEHIGDLFQRSLEHTRHI